jgi:hypothetical protein
MHCVVPGSQDPVHDPLTHADAAHGIPAPHAPVAEHVCTLLPCGEQRVAFGAQEPAHAPETQARSPQSAAAPQVPVALQV